LQMHDFRVWAEEFDTAANGPISALPAVVVLRARTATTTALTDERRPDLQSSEAKGNWYDAMISEHDRQILSQLPDWNPTGDAVAQRRAWEELATVYNQDLPAIGGLEQNIELRPGLRADIAVPKGAGRHPVVVYLHGGGWAFGSPALPSQAGDAVC